MPPFTERIVAGTATLTAVPGTNGTAGTKRSTLGAGRLQLPGVCGLMVGSGLLAATGASKVTTIGSLPLTGVLPSGVVLTTCSGTATGEGFGDAEPLDWVLD
ncbi:MAG TPA: hypothetical protein VN738_00545 [Acidothermaceae bacterium]|nr:hypothetical protein [Acidothermaceae bacterium]